MVLTQVKLEGKHLLYHRVIAQVGVCGELCRGSQAVDELVRLWAQSVARQQPLKCMPSDLRHGRGEELRAVELRVRVQLLDDHYAVLELLRLQHVVDVLREQVQHSRTRPVRHHYPQAAARAAPNAGARVWSDFDLRFSRVRLSFVSIYSAVRTPVAASSGSVHRKLCTQVQVEQCGQVEALEVRADGPLQQIV